MAESNNSSALHWILGAALLLIALFVVVALVGSNSQADSVTTKTNIENATPSFVGSLWFNEGLAGNQFIASSNLSSDAEGDYFTPLMGGPKQFHVSGIVEDDNGQDDILAVNLTLFANGLALGCTPDDLDCYFDPCNLQDNANPERVDFSCNVGIEHYAKSSRAGGQDAGGDWTATVKAADLSSSVATKSDTVDIATITGLTIPTLIDFGTMTQGQETNSTNNPAQPFIQQGNDITDVTVDGSALGLGCTVLGTIPITNIKWALTDANAGTDTLTTSPDDTDLGIGYNTDASDKTKTLYWYIRIPDDNVVGICSGTSTIAAIPA
jgi:hypothetical protein